MSKLAWTSSTSSWSSRVSIRRISDLAALFVDLDRGRRLHRLVGGLDLDALGLERLADRGQIGGRGQHADRSSSSATTSSAPASIATIRSSSVYLDGVEHDHAALLEHPGDRVRLAEVAAGAVEGVADLGAGAVAVVAHRLDQDRGAAGAVALVDDPLDRGRVGALAGAAVDRPLDVVLGHRVLLRLVDRERQRRIALGVAAALTRGDADRPRELREQLSPLRVGRSLLVLDRRPFRMAGHTVILGQGEAGSC